MKTKEAIEWLKENLSNRIKCISLPDSTYFCKYYSKNGKEIFFQVYGSDRKNVFYIDNGYRRIKINLKYDNVSVIINKILEFSNNNLVKNKIEDIKRNVLYNDYKSFNHIIYSNNVKNKAKELGFNEISIKFNHDYSVLISLRYEIYEISLKYNIITTIYNIGIKEISYLSQDFIDKKTFINFSGKLADLIYYLQNYSNILKKLNFFNEV